MLKQRINVLSPAQIVLFMYVLAVLLIGSLLMLPISWQPGASLTPLDALFTAVSAISVTGLTTVSTADTFSGFGTTVLLVAFQFGAVGIMTLGSFYWMLMGQHIGLLQRKLIMIDLNRSNLAGLVGLMRLVLIMALVIQLTGTLLFAGYFYLSGEVHSLSQALYFGLFHAISAYTNAGFDLFGDSFLRYSNDVYIQLLSMLLIVSGAIGFPVLAELWRFIRSGQGKRFRFSLFTKLTLSMHAVLIVVGAVCIWLSENSHSFGGMSVGKQLLNSLFLSVTSRSAGLTTIDVSSLHQATLLIISGLMFIGASPSSVGGGVRTTTVAVIILTVVMFFKGEQAPRAFGRSISREDILKSFVFFVLSLLLVMAGVIAMLALEGSGKFDLSEVLFEVTSAFGTCGMSTDITNYLHAGAKITLMVLMFSGRIGMFLLISLFRPRKQQPDIKYPEEKLIVG